MMNNLKQKLGKSIENRRDELTAMADKIFDLSEVSGEEYQSAELLCSYLEKEGFEVERGTGFPTAFRAEWRNGSGGPVIGILVEYDALEKIGHACGHHLQGPAGIGQQRSDREASRHHPRRPVGRNGSRLDGDAVRWQPHREGVCPPLRKDLQEDTASCRSRG